MLKMRDVVYELEQLLCVHWYFRSWEIFLVVFLYVNPGTSAIIMKISFD